jgi:fermentation-respiration switch protein FrsA (DUF1100 family)
VEHRVPAARRAGGGWPTTLDDVAAAIDHLADARRALDLARVVAIGHSRGGHLAAGRRRARGRARVPVTAASSQAGVRRPALAWELRLSDGVVGDLLGGARRVPSATRLASPARGPLGVPVLLTHGGRDDIVPPRERVRRGARARRRVDCRAADEDHFGHIDPATRSGRRCWNGWRDDARARRGARRRRPARGFRARFEHAGDGIYLDGNSLGRLPIATRERVLAGLDQWSREVVSGWHDWIDLPLRAGDALGALLAPRRAR